MNPHSGSLSDGIYSSWRNTLCAGILGLSLLGGCATEYKRPVTPAEKVPEYYGTKVESPRLLFRIIPEYAETSIDGCQHKHTGSVSWTSYMDGNGKLYMDKNLERPREKILHAYKITAEGYHSEEGNIYINPISSPTILEVELVKFKKRKIGVKGFKDFIGGREELGDYVADLMTTYLTDVSFLSIIERTQIDQFFDERDLTEADIFDPKKKTEFALLGLDYLMLGTIRQDQRNYIATSRFVKASDGISAVSAMGNGFSPEEAIKDLSEELVSKVREYLKKMDKEKEVKK